MKERKKKSSPDQKRGIRKGSCIKLGDQGPPRTYIKPTGWKKKGGIIAGNSRGGGFGVLFDLDKTS